MKRVKLIYISIIILCTFVFTGIIGWLSVYTTRGILQENALNTLRLSCENTCLRFDTTINSIEQTVDTISADAVLRLKDLERFKTDKEYVEQYTQELTPLLLDMAYSTTGAMSIYIRYNNDFADANAGAFYVLNKETGEFEVTQTTNLDNPDGENIIWYTLPIEKGSAVWTEPYHNKLIDYYMISYTVPFYLDGELIGVVGMDIDYEYMMELVESIVVYETGYAFLISPEGRVISHEVFDFFEQYTSDHRKNQFLTEISDGYTIYETGNETKIYTRAANNMIVGISAPNNEIYSDSILLRSKVIAVIFAGVVCAALLATVIVSRLFNMSEIDRLTGVKNRKGFENSFALLDNRKLDSFSLFIFDIDNFKQINDTYGHNAGDKALANAARIASKLLGSNLFARWGGDEFIGLLPKETAEQVLESIRNAISQSYDPLYGSFTVSIGLTDVSCRKSLSEITAVADSALYHSKSNGKNKISKA